MVELSTRCSPMVNSKDYVNTYVVHSRSSLAFPCSALQSSSLVPTVPEKHDAVHGAIADLVAGLLVLAVG